MIGAAAGGFAVTGRASVIFAGVTGSAVISNSGTAIAALGCGLIASGRTLGLVTGITGSSAISDGRADTVGLLFSIISAGGAGFGGTSVILTVAGRSGDLIFSRTIGRGIFVFGRAVTRLLAGHTGDGMNHTGRKLGRGASFVKIIMFHTIGIVFDNIPAADVVRTTADIFTKIIGEPVDTGDFEAGSGSKRLRQ